MTVATTSAATRGLVSRRVGLLGWGLVLFVAWLVAYPLLLTFLETPAAAFAEALTAPDGLRALVRTLAISLASVVAAALLGVPLAFVFERWAFPGSRLLGRLLALPVALPPLVGALAFLFLYGESGFLARAVRALSGSTGAPWHFVGPAAILWVHAYSMYVYFYLFVRAALRRLDPSLGEAAASLGASPARRLLRVELPLLAPALGAAALLVFMTSLGSFSAPYLFGGSFRVMTTQITASKLNGDLDLAKAETALLAVMALLALVLWRRLDRADVRSLSRGVARPPMRLRRRSTRILVASAASGVAAVCLLPHLTLLVLAFVPPGTWTVEAWPPVLSATNFRALAAEPERFRPIANSLWMAGVSTLLAVALGLASALSARRRGARAAFLDTLIAVPWAVPGTALALALATAFAVSQPVALRFVFIGTIVMLPLAYTVRSLPLTGRAALAGLRQLDPSLEEAAASLGDGPWRRLRRVVLPLVRPALVAGASVAFLGALGDFVVSIVLYSYETRPISIEILSSLRLQELGVAAAYGVILTALSATAFYLWGEVGEAG